MTTFATDSSGALMHPVEVHIVPSIDRRNRLTTTFRLLLGLPHLLLVGGPIAFAFTWSSSSESGTRYEWGGGGLLGAVAAVAAVIAWFAILFTGRYPQGLWNLVAFYLRWRVRAVAYVALLRDEYPPFGEGTYPAMLELREPMGPRDRLSVAFRIVLVIPHLIVVWCLGFAWAVTTTIAWFAILFTGRYPRALYDFGAGALRWSTRMEAYLLLLHDDYPPFTLA
jgi:hypothetical protein